MLLDEIGNGKPFITEKRWEDKYRDHEHKARRARLGIQKNITKVTEWEVSVGPGTPKVITEGEQMKRYAEYDIERKYRSMYVDHGLFRGQRQWLSPLKSTGFSIDSKTEIGIAKACCEAVKKEAKKYKITL